MVHPFIEGNGRTARAACYYLICMKQGKILGGKKTVPELIRENRGPYIAGLRAADEAYEKGQYDVTDLAKYLEDLLKKQVGETSLSSSFRIVRKAVDFYLSRAADRDR